MLKTKTAVKSNPRNPKSPQGDIRIAAIGGSAGSLEALEKFLSNMPPTSGIGFVIIQHLDPTHKDILPELLQRSTRMEVSQARDNVKVRPNCVYVIPPNKDMSIKKGRLHLQPPSMPRGQRMPIDFFLRSLAEDKEEKAIAIIFSGMGSDGTLGIKAIKAKLGLVMVQSVETAKFDGMPRNAIETGVADFTAGVDQLPRKLLSYVRHYAHVPKELSETDKQATGTLQKIFFLLREQTGRDFTFYKKNTIYRRIERRMNIHQMETMSQYLRFLQRNRHEIDLLFKDLLIGVTNFFRDPAAFDVLKEKVLPGLLNNRPRRSTIRIWVVGCSTGEEAYSLAILFKEFLRETKQDANYKIQIFATDIDQDAIDKARQGLYPANITADVSLERLQKYFLKEDSYYRVRKEIREMIVFAPQNVLADPPFTKLDMISCRNLLIYFTQELQKKLLPLFHYALNTNGVLFLGTSETIGTFNDLFSIQNGKWKIFSRKESMGPTRSFMDLPPMPSFTRKSPDVFKERKAAEIKVHNLAEAKLIETYTPAAVFINSEGNILFVNGRTGKYLEPSTGEASMNVFAMAREGLRIELAGAVRKAAAKKQEVIIRNLKVRTDGGFQAINLIVTPFTKPEALEGLLMVVFEDVAPTRRPPHLELKPLPLPRKKSVVDDLELELKYTKEHLQTTIEEMETSQEELKSSNEELQSTNEELQSTNEELTTSKEELQSLNEELITVNAEMQNKVEELSSVNNDMKNLLNSTEIATVFLDNELNVKRFTVPASKIINLIASDVGRPVSHIVSNLKYTGLIDDVREVLKTLVPKEIRVETSDGKWFLMRIIPYRTYENVIDGVVITFTDAGDFKKMERAFQDSQERNRALESDHSEK